MTFKKIDPLQRLHLRRVWLMLQRVQGNTFNERDLAFHAECSAPSIYRILRPVREMRELPDSEVSACLHVLFQADRDARISTGDWRRIDADAITKSRQIIGDMQFKVRRLMTMNVILPMADAAGAAS